MLREHLVNQKDNFIAGWYYDHPLLDTIIEYYASNDKTPGCIQKDNQMIVDKEHKDSVDTRLQVGTDLFLKYATSYLQPSVDMYIEKYPMCNRQSPWSIISDINIQYYPPSGGYHAWHTERTSGVNHTSACHLVFMTYLNTVHEGGETEFFHQSLKIKPEKGLTLIWPSDWTFTHKGLPSKEGKMIATGWFHFTE